jgi:hypothetical protein
MAEEAVLMPRIFRDGSRPDLVCGTAGSDIGVPLLGAFELRPAPLRLVLRSSSGSGEAALSLIGLTLRDRGRVGDDGGAFAGKSFHTVSAGLLAVVGL